MNLEEFRAEIKPIKDDLHIVKEGLLNLEAATGGARFSQPSLFS